MRWVVPVVLGVAVAAGCTLDRVGHGPRFGEDAGREPGADAGTSEPEPDAGWDEAPECVLPTSCVIAVEWDCCGGCEVAVTREELDADPCLQWPGDLPPAECSKDACEDCATRGACQAGHVATCVEGECVAIAPPEPGATEPPAGGGAEGGETPDDSDGGRSNDNPGY
jgi:hypothetical protein